MTLQFTLLIYCLNILVAARGVDQSAAEISGVLLNATGDTVTLRIYENAIGKPGELKIRIINTLAGNFSERELAFHVDKISQSY